MVMIMSIIRIIKFFWSLCVNYYNDSQGFGDGTGVLTSCISLTDWNVLACLFKGS